MTIKRVPQANDNEDIGRLSDDDVVAIWLNAPDPEHPTPRERAALAAMEARNLDF